jgi:hypothetical protein
VQWGQNGDDPQEDLAKFGYKLNMKNILINFLWLPT